MLNNIASSINVGRKATGRLRLFRQVTRFIPGPIGRVARTTTDVLAVRQQVNDVLEAHNRPDLAIPEGTEAQVEAAIADKISEAVFVYREENDDKDDDSLMDDMLRPVAIARTLAKATPEQHTRFMRASAEAKAMPKKMFAQAVKRETSERALRLKSNLKRKIDR